MTSPVETGTSPHLVGTTGTRSIGQLVSDVSTDLSQIMRGEIELAKVEIKRDVSKASKGAGMFAGAALFGLYGLGLLFLGMAAVIAIWLPWWAGLLIMAAVLFAVAGILALIGKKQMDKVKGKPEKAIDNAQQTVEALKTAPATFKGERVPAALAQPGDEVAARATRPTGGAHPVDDPR